MKVLFAVSNEEISESIIKKYQKEYKQIISYKNVYYFNAILKELQKDKSYDRVVISEDLEAFTHTQYDQIDKFIFEKLDTISDEASDLKGNDTPIILICSDRRTKSEQMLVKLFGIGIYNAIIGNDRSVDEVCKLINRPRVKKEAKLYYQIDTEEVKYQAENENDVSEMEIQNILAHYKRLGKNEDRYIDSFNNIAAQYNDTQLRIITKFLPLNVRAVLEEKSTKYQQIMSFNNSVSDTLRKNKRDKEDGPSQILLKSKNKGNVLSGPVVIPSSVNMASNKKLARRTIPKIETKQQDNNLQQPEMIKQDIQEFKPQVVETEIVKPDSINEQNNIQEQMPEPVKRGRGRPRKNPTPTQVTDVEKTKRGRGRPRKNPVIEEQEEFMTLPGLKEEETILPGFETEEETILPGFETEEETILPGFETEEETITQQTSRTVNEMPQDNFLPGFEDELEEPDVMLPGFEENSIEQEDVLPKNYIQTIDLTNLLTQGKKITTFVGTSKNGTSFIVNNIATLMSSIGVNTAILDTTQNRNAYYIYTKNEEELREIATHSIEGLAQGVANGIKVNPNLTVYTSLPNENDQIIHVDEILQTLLMKHSLILIDTDFSTPFGYFKQSQETYLVQSMDILTIQPLTAFLRELKAKNILDETKLKIILNKTIRIRGIKDATIIGGMAFYNDPAMSFMTELFDRDRIKYVSIPFDEEVYIRYLEGIIECEISLKGYSKVFLQTLKALGNMVYPTVSNSNYQPPSAYSNGGGNFSPSMNNTLDRMKKSY